MFGTCVVCLVCLFVCLVCLFGLRLPSLLGRRPRCAVCVCVRVVFVFGKLMQLALRFNCAGTPGYIAPEILEAYFNKVPYGKTVC